MQSTGTWRITVRNQWSWDWEFKATWARWIELSNSLVSNGDRFGSRYQIPKRRRWPNPIHIDKQIRKDLLAFVHQPSSNRSTTSPNNNQSKGKQQRFGPFNTELLYTSYILPEHLKQQHQHQQFHHPHHHSRHFDSLILACLTIIKVTMVSNPILLRIDKGRISHSPHTTTVNRYCSLSISPSHVWFQYFLHSHPICFFCFLAFSCLTWSDFFEKSERHEGYAISVVELILEFHPV